MLMVAVSLILSSTIISTFKHIFITLHVSGICSGSTLIIPTNFEGIVESPQHPNAYPSNAQCDWLFETGAGYRVMITFEVFDIGKEAIPCDDGSMQVR